MISSIPISNETHSQPESLLGHAEVSVTKSSEIPFKLQSEIEELKELLVSFDLEQMVAPFLPNTFQVARKRFYKKVETLFEEIPFEQKQSLRLKLLAIVDTEIFPIFIERVRARYRNLVLTKHYKVPLTVNVSELKDKKSLQEYQALCYSVAEWLLQAEISSDLISRAEVYGYYTAKNPLKLQEIEQKFIVSKKSLDIIPRRVANMVANNVVHVFSGVFTPSAESRDTKWPKLGSLAETMFGNDKIPWALLASGTSVAYIAGGYFFSKVLSTARKHLNKTQRDEEINRLNSLTQHMTEFVRSSNEELQNIIACCCTSSRQEELDQNIWDLNCKIEQLIEYYTSGRLLENCQLLTEKNLSLKLLTSKEADDGWVIYDMQEPEEKNEDDDFVVCDFKTQSA